MKRPSRTIASIAAISATIALAPAYLAPAGATGSIAPQTVTATSALAIIATIPAGRGPNFQVAVSRDDTVYIAHPDRSTVGGGSLFVMSPGSLALDDTVTGITRAVYVAVDRNDDTVYVGRDNSQFAISVIDGRTLTVVDTINLGANYSGIAVNSTDDTVYVSFGTTQPQNFLRVINGRNTDDSFTRTVGQIPIGIAVDDVDDTVYVANSDSPGSVSVMRGSTSTVDDSFSPVPGPFDLALSSQGDLLYTSNQVSHSISVIDTSTGSTSTSSLGTGRFPRYIALSPSDDTLYVAAAGSDLFQVMNARNLDDSYTLNLGSRSIGTAVRSDGTVYVSLSPFGASNPGGVLALAQVTPTLTTTAGLADDTATITLTVQGGYQAEGATVTSVNFDDTVATGWTRTGVNTWSGPVPAGVGNLPVTVTFNGGRQAFAGNFVYSTDPAPTVTGISPASGTIAGGTPVTITGTNFVTNATATVGGVACTSPTVVNATTLTCTTGAGAAGTVNVVVTNPDTQAATGAGLYTYLDVAPGVSSVAPVSGPIAGGTTITINGTGFLAGASITVGGVSCDDTVLVSSTEMTCTTGPGAAGAVSVVVTNPGSLPGTLPNGFTYIGPNPPSPSTPPSPPVDVTAVPGNGQATISWRPPTNPGSFPVTTYLVTAAPDGQSCLVGAPTLTCTVTGLVNGTAYTFTVQALNGAGWSAPSTASEAVKPTPGPAPRVSITLDQGTRAPAGRHDRISTSGDTRGIDPGVRLTPWIRYAGQKNFSQGRATIIVQSDGTFRWKRLISRSRNLVAYVSWTDVESNRVRWATVR